MQTESNLRDRLVALGLCGLSERWDEIANKPWLQDVVKMEEDYRHRTGFARRLKAAKLGNYKPVAYFDWAWPKKIDRDVIEELMTLEFMKEHENIVFIGPNGVGKTLFAKNIALEAVRKGFTAVVWDVIALLNVLSAKEKRGTLTHALAQIAKPDVLVLDEFGQVAFGERHGDLLFAVINARYLKKSTIITTNTPFTQWGSFFPNTSCVGTLVDRLLHRSEVVDIEGPTWRAHEAELRLKQKQAARKAKKKK